MSLRPLRETAGLFARHLRGMVCSTGRLVAVVGFAGLLLTHLASAPLSSALALPAGRDPAGSPVQGQARQVSDNPRDDRDPAEVISEFLNRLGPAGSRRPLRYYSIPPPSDGAAPGVSAAGATAAAKHEIDLEITRNAYDPPAGDRRRASGRQTPRETFDAFLREVVDGGVEQGLHGEAARDAIHNGPWGDELIRATIEVLDANGDDSPKAIKQLIGNSAASEADVPPAVSEERAPVVSEEHALLMWMARDTLVRRAKARVIERLKGEHPGMRFEVTGLDSGSYGSVASDIDKTLHLVAWDADGNQVKALGPGGRVLGGDIDRFLGIVVEEFNRLGSEYDATHPINRSMDVEFFSSDTLPERFPGMLGRGATHSSTETVVARVADAFRQNFAALQRNPGPAYQFVAKVVAQVIGRTLEQDVLLKQRIDYLNGLRQGLDRLPVAERRDLFLQEMLTSTHAPAVVVSEEGGEVVIRAIDVTEFLERNNLALRYEGDLAAGNALGDYEKLAHYREKIIDAQGRFDAATYALYQNDIAKYGSRSILDLATFLFADNDPDKPAAFGEFYRRFGAHDAQRRFSLAEEPPNQRPYTREVHDALFEPVLERQYARNGMTPEARRRIAADLELLWRSQGVSETLLAIKENTDLSKQYPPAELFRELIEFIEDNEPSRFGDLSGLNDAEIVQRKVEAAQRLHVEAEESGAVRLGGGYLNLALDRWLGDARVPLDPMIRIEQAKLQRLRGERDALMRRAVPPNTPEWDARQRELRSLDQKIEDVADLLRRLRNDPEEMEVGFWKAGHELAWRMFELFQRQSNDPNFARMMELVEPRYREDLILMWKVWTAQATERERQDLAVQLGVELARLAGWSTDVGRRLGYSYLQAFGVDTDAYFRNPAGGGAANEPGRILGRFIQQNYLDSPMHAGQAADSALRLVRVMQMTRDLPWDVRMNVIAEAATTELIMPIPAVGPLYVTWQGYKAGDPKAIAGGLINTAQEVTQMWIGAATPGLEQAMIRAGQAGRAAALTEAAALGAGASLMLSMARTFVEIVGTEAFAPVQDHYFQLAYKGYVDAQSPGFGFFTRAGTLRPDSTVPVTPIIEPEQGALEFVYLKPQFAQLYLDDLWAEGHNEAALALLHLAGLDENLDTGFDPAGTCSPDRPAACPVMIDLKTDFDALTVEAGSRRLDTGDMPPSMLDRAELVRQRVIGRWQELATLQRVTRERIDRDRELRQRVPDHLNLWLLAARENLGLHLDQDFRRQTELLYQRLVAYRAGMADGARELADEAERAWTRWQAQASSLEDAASVRQRFLEIMSPRIAYEQRLATINEQIQAAGRVPWSAQGLGEYLGRSIRRWLDTTPGVAAGALETREDPVRQQVEALERRAAAMSVFVDNTYVNRRLPTEPYTLAGAADWYGEQIRTLLAADRELFDESSPRDPNPGDTIARRQEQQAQLLEEYRLLMQGFGEIDAVVAPKVAQLLLMDWIEGSGRFDNDVHPSVDFLWYDATTQEQIRRKVADDLVRGRRLIPQYRAQATAFRNLLSAELNEIYVEYVRLAEDRFKQELRGSLRLADAIADAHAEPVRFNGELELRVDPYLVNNGDDLSIVVDTRVDHDPYRAVDVEVTTDTQIVPYDRINEIIDRQELERALSIAGLAEDELLFVVQVKSSVTRAEPLEGHEERAYTDLPTSGDYLLLVPGEVEAPPVLADPTVTTCAIRSDAPVDFPVENAIDYCDPDAGSVHEYDRVAVFFTPARDMREPLEEREPFQWRILNPNGGTVLARGRTLERIGAFAPVNENSLPLAKRASPGALAVVVDLWDRDDEPDPARAGTGPGTYTVQTVAAQYEHAGTRAFGQGDFGLETAVVGRNEDGSPTYAEWQDEGTFEVESARLRFQGFVTEQVHDVWIQEHPSIGYGKLSVADPVIDGSTVTLEATATWTDPGAAPPPGNTGAGGNTGGGTGETERVDAGPGGQRLALVEGQAEHTAHGRLTIEFPVEMAPGHEEMGELRARMDALERGDLFFTAGMHLLIPAERAPPDRYLLAGSGGPPVWAPDGGEPDELDCFGGEIPGWDGERFRIEDWQRYVGNETNITGGAVGWVWPRQPVPGDCLRQEGSEVENRTILLAGEKPEAGGDAALPLPRLLHDTDALWVIPVFLNLTDDATPTRRSLTMKTYGYAVYGVQPGTYTAPLPADGPEEGNPPDTAPEDAEIDEPDEPGDPGNPRDPDTTDPTGDGDDPTGDPPRVEPDPNIPGADDPGADDPTGGDPVDPNSVDPSSPDVTGLIRPWITVAEPPRNATEGADFRYNNRGVVVGTTRDGGIITAPDLPFDAGYLWQNRVALDLDSVDHCRLEEYVVANLEGASIDHCVGRYSGPTFVDVPDLTNRTLADAQRLLDGVGLTLVPTLIGAAPTPQLSDRIVEQRPVSLARTTQGSAVEVDVYSAYHPPLVDVPDLDNRTLAEARRLLDAVGLVLSPSLVGAAPVPDLSNRIAGQRPTGLAQVEPGTAVEVEVYSEYVAPEVVVPNLAGLRLSAARSAAEAVGLRLQPTLLGAAPTPEQANRVLLQTTAPGTRVAEGTTIGIDVYGDHVPPPVPVPPDPTPVDPIPPVIDDPVVPDPGRTPDVVWIRSGPVVDPPGQQHDSGWAERGQQLIQRVTVGTNVMQYLVQFNDGRRVTKDVRVRFDFDAPPTRIAAGSRLTLNFRGSTDFRVGPGGQFAEVVDIGMHGDGIPLGVDVRMSQAEQQPVRTIRYDVPTNLPDEFRIYARMGGVRVVWTYRRSAAVRTRPTEPGPEPIGPVPPAVEVTGPYGLRCPAEANGMPLIADESGYDDGPHHHNFICWYREASSFYEKVFSIDWEDSTKPFDQFDVEKYCRAEMRSGTTIRLFSNSKHVMADSEIEFVDESWARSILLDMIRRVEPYASSCRSPVR